MRRFRNWRRRAAALALAPVAVATFSAIGPASAAERGATTFEASQSRVGPHGKVTLEGRFRKPTTNAAPATGGTAATASESQAVRIQFRALGSGAWRDAKRTRTGRRGGFRERVGVDRSGRFRAVSADGRKTAPEKVRVKSRTTSRIATESPKVG